MINSFGINMEEVNLQDISRFEMSDNLEYRLETNPESVSDNEILSKFDDNQLDYINSIQENPSWQDMSISEKIDYVKSRVGKFCQNTEIGRYWSQPVHWQPIVHCLIRNMSKLY